MAQSQLSAVETVGFELSAQQKRLWRFGQAESCRAIGVAQIDGDVDQSLLNEALKRVVDRYEVLRTTLHVEPSRRYPLQVVGREPQITLNIANNLLRLELPGMFADFASLRNICDALSVALTREYAHSVSDAIVQYVDYAGWQQTLLDHDEATEALAYWHVRKQRSFATELLNADVDATSFDKQPESPAPEGLSPTFLLAAWFVLLWRLTGEDPVIGVEFDGRTFSELDRTVGLFARWLPMSVRLNSQATLEDVAKEVAIEQEKARRWQDYFELESKSDSQERFAAGFEVRDLRSNSIFSLVDYDVAYEPCELKLVCTLKDSGLYWNIHGPSRIRDCFQQLLKTDLETRIDQLDILTPEMRRRVLIDWNQTAREFPRHANLHELFEAAVVLNPQNEALNRRANQLAHHLKHFGCGPETIVGLCLNHSDELVMAGLAILKSGAAFVPLNPVLPTERLRSLAEKTSVSLIVTTAELAAIFENTRIVDIRADEIANESDSNPASEATAANLAYVMYTSGSTGGPKGVMIEHGSLLNLAFALEEAVYSRAPEARSVSLNGPLSFDTSIKQLVQLCFGRKLCVVPPELRNTPSEFVEFLARNEIDVLDCTPSHLRLLLAEGLRQPSLVLVGGEDFDRQTWEQVRQSETQFVNLYGPTECTVDTTFCHVNDAKTPSLGRPLANVRTYILDENGAPVPPGVIGELHIGGAGVGRGYFNATDLTASHFIPDPFSTTPGARLYKTGDFARFFSNGTIEYRGRRDDQVKIRGSRVELNEVADAIRQHPAVDEVVVLPQSSDKHEQILIAYIVFHRGARVGANELRKSVVSMLPDFMTPARFVEVKSIPLTPGGKVDRQLLASLPGNSLDEGLVEHPPQTPTEETTAAIWREVLGQNAIGRDANFFELGGYSLLALRAIARLRQAFDFELPVRMFFDNPTVATLSAAVDRLRGIERPLQNDLRHVEFQGAERELSPGQEGLSFISQLRPGDTSYNILLAIRLQGELQLPVLEQSLQRIFQRHEPLRTRFAIVDGVPKAIVSDEVNVDLQTIELSHERVYEWAATEAVVPFDILQSPLYRLHLVKLGPGEHALIFVTHHLVFDGPSAQIFLRELADLYGGSSQLPELAIGYSDYVEWQRKKDLQKELDYWRENLKDAPAELAWPDQKAAPKATRVDQAFEQVVLPPDFTEQLKDACRREQVTPYVIFLTAYIACLHRWAGHADLVVTSPFAARTHAALEPLIGFFINNLVLRVRVPQDATYRSLLPVVRDAVLGAMAHQDVPFGKLLEAASVPSRSGETPFNQLRFDFQEQGVRSYQLPDLTISLESADTFMVRYDLFLFVRDINDSYTVSLGYDASVFESRTISSLTRRFQTVLQELVEKPESRIREQNFAELLKLKPKLVRLPNNDGLIDESFLDPQKPWPLVIEARHKQMKLVNWCKSNRELISEKLLRHSGILFRNFEVDGIEEFEKCVAAFDHELIAYHERSTPRTRISGNIYTSTEYSADQSIPLHSESSYAHCWPMKIWFFCVEPAATGGQTITADNREVFKRIDAGLRERMTKTSVMYVRNYHPRIDLPWPEVFQTYDRSEVESYCRQHLIGYKWLEGDRLQTVQVRQAVARHPHTGEWVWFNQSHLFHINNLPQAIREVLQQSLQESDWPRNAYFGNGAPIESEDLEQIAAAYGECAVPIDWRRGDVLMLDNMLASHGREPFTGNRKIAVAMAEPYSLNSHG